MRTMSKSPKKTGRTSQQELFGEPVSLNIDLQLRNALALALKKSNLDRWGFCAEMSRLTGVEVSKHGLDAWTSEARSKTSDQLDMSGNKRWGIPAELIPAFCKTAKDWTPLHILLSVTPFELVSGPKLIKTEIAKLEKQIDRLNIRRENLQAHFKELSE